METESVKNESLQTRLVEDSLSSELCHVEEHLEARFHPSERIACVWKSILAFIQFLIIFCSPKKNKSS